MFPLVFLMYLTSILFGAGMVSATTLQGLYIFFYMTAGTFVLALFGTGLLIWEVRREIRLENRLNRWQLRVADAEDVYRTAMRNVPPMRFFPGKMLATERAAARRAAKYLRWAEARLQQAEGRMTDYLVNRKAYERHLYKLFA